MANISNCSTASARSTGSLNNGVFVTPRKPCGKAKSKGPNETGSNDELSTLSSKIAELEEEIKKLRAENEILQKLKGGELSEDERQAMESNLAALKEEVEKLRKQIEDEMERNKELVYQQNTYECSLKTMQADLELTNSQVAALQQQIISLEQMNVDITESREELESQCSRLHGMNIALEEEKLAFQDRLDEIESNWKNAYSTKEELSADLLSCRERHQSEIETLEQSLKEKLSTVEKLAEERTSLEGTVVSYKNKIDHLKLEMDESLRNQMETMDELKIEKEMILVSLGNLKEERGQTQQEMLHLQDVITRKEELCLENIRKCQNLEDQIVILQQGQKAEVEALKNDLKVTKTTLEKSEIECKTISETLQELETNNEETLLYSMVKHFCNKYKEIESNTDIACRILTNTERYDHVTPALRAIRWLPVEEHLKYRETLITYKCMNGLAPPYLSKLFIKRNEIHDLNTRNNKALHIPQHKTVSGQRTFYYRAVKLWNDLDEDLKKLPWKSFKTKLKNKMLNKN
ncbi:Hypothetical predicted protein [Paramuricea clavata]|uniref:Uncharacterized protein n=1 Tax=Paramuricea clavata TaxID=317549 RepID=A0A7D9DGE1_PARCT|nr:Hypothetical predicted protein [Paramuricea clavata]